MTKKGRNGKYAVDCSTAFIITMRKMGRYPLLFPSAENPIQVPVAVKPELLLQAQVPNNKSQIIPFRSILPLSCA